MLKRQIQLAEPGPQDSSGSRAKLPAPACSAQVDRDLQGRLGSMRPIVGWPDQLTGFLARPPADGKYWAVVGRLAEAVPVLDPVADDSHPRKIRVAGPQ